MRTARSRVIATFTGSGDGYTDMFNASLRALGYELLEGCYSFRWVLNNARRVGYCHFHWPSFAYHDPRVSRRPTLRAFLLFAVFLTFIRIVGIRILWTAHNLYPHDGGKNYLAHRLARRLIVGLSDLILAHGPTAQQILSREFPRARGKTCSIEHGHWIGYYPDTATVSEARRELDIHADAYVYLFFGVCKEYKNIETLIRAFQEIRDGSVLVVAGKFQSEAYRSMITAMLEPLGERARLHPRFIGQAEVQHYLTASDCVVLPYKDVLTSGAAMLALSFGKPVIAPRMGALVDVVVPIAGILYEPRTTADLTAAMRQARSTGFHGAAIRAHARSFDWDASARVMKRALDSLDAHVDSASGGGTPEGVPAAVPPDVGVGTSSAREQR